MMKKQYLAVLILLHLAFALGFYLENRDAGVLDISSDTANIIPICMKLDDPSRFAGDLYLNDVNDVKYYTPAYVQLLRISSFFTGGDYIQALNVIGFFTHFLYGICWFFLFYTLRKDFWIALLFSILMKGVIWPPGGELLGLSDLWTVMPRTVYFALIPIPFLLFVHLKRYNLVISALALGLILNLHPISGIGINIAYFTLFITYDLYWKRKPFAAFAKSFMLAASVCILGMFPYVAVYFLNIKADGHINTAEFEMAFHSRLGYVFSDPILFVKQWNRPVFWLFSGLYLIFCFFDASPGRRVAKLIGITALVVLISANASVYAEQFVNQIMAKDLRFSFQLIRYQKFILVLFQIASYLLLTTVLERVAIGERSKQIALAGYLLICSVSLVNPISRLPLIGDDLTTSIMPNSFMIAERPRFFNKPDLAKMITYIKKELPRDAVFYGDYRIRTGAGNPVQLDPKAAGMLIEGNPERFVQWYQDSEKLKTSDPDGKLEILRQRNIDYILSETRWEGLVPIKQIGKTYLYKL